MNENRFDEILEYLCSGIMSKKERENVKDELYDHLLTKFEINLATGMDEEQAAESAVNALGNRIILRDNLSKVHSYFPALSVKKSMTLLRNGETTNILNILGKHSDWFMLARGDNVFSYTCDYGEENIYFKIISQTTYEGV